MYLINNRYLWYVELFKAYKNFSHPVMRQRCRLIKIVHYLWAKIETKRSYIRMMYIYIYICIETLLCKIPRNYLRFSSSNPIESSFILNRLQNMSYRVMKQNESSSFSTHRKPTFTGNNLNFDSYHSIAHKETVVKSLVDSAKNLCDENTYSNEMKIMIS